MARRLHGSGQGNSSTLSYIDLISGGFAAAFFMFLIFVSFPIETASTPSQGSRFLDVWVEWQDNEVRANLIVTYTPDDAAGVLAQPLTISLNSTVLSQSPKTGKITFSGSQRVFWTGIAQSGFGLSGDSPLQRIDSEGQTWAGMWMRFSDPCPGTYDISVASHGVSMQGLLALLGDPGKVRDITARARLILSDGTNDTTFVPNDGSEGVEFRFNSGIESVPTAMPGGPVIIERAPSTAPSSLLHCEAQ